MNREALGYAIATVARAMAICATFAVTLTAAIWLPTLALQKFAHWPFLDAYLIGCPFGLLVVALIGLGIMTYRQKVREP